MKRPVAAVGVCMVVVAIGVVLAATWFFAYGKKAARRAPSGVPPGWEGEVAGNMPAPGPGGVVALTAAQDIERKIIKTGALDLVVQDFDAAVEQIQQLAQQVGGFVASQNFATEPTGWRRGQVTVRVPSPQFDAAVQKLEQCGQVTSLRIDTEDVTEEFVDLEARLRNQQHEEEVLLALFNRPSRLPDVLAVERELARVRGEIEQSEGRLRYLKRQVSLSTISVSLSELGQAVIGPTRGWRVVYHARSAGRVLVAVVRGLITAVIYIAVVGSPLWVGLGLWVLVRRRRRRGGG